MTKKSSRGLIARLSTTTEGTRKAINPGGKKDFGATEITKYSEAKDALKGINDLDKYRILADVGEYSVENTYPLVKVLNDIDDARSSLTRAYIDGMPSDTYKRKLGILQDFEDKKYTEIASTIMMIFFISSPCYSISAMMFSSISTA